MSFDAKKIGPRIKKHRNGRRMSQAALGKQVNVSSNYIGKLEKGERVATIEIYVALAEYFDVSLDEFILGKTQDEIQSRSRSFLKAKLSAVVDLLNVIIRSL